MTMEATTDTDRAAIVSVVLDVEVLDSTTAEEMIDATAMGVGKTRAATDEERRLDIELEDVYDTIASVTVRGPIYHEYLHLVRTSAGWKIANALWQRTLA